MERWEPSTSTQERARVAPPRVVRPAGDRRAVWANAILAAGGRAGIGLALIGSRVVPLPALVQAGLSVFVLLALLLGTFRAWRTGWPAWGTVWLMDFATLTLLTPVLVWNGFVASGPARMMAAERRAYLETILAAFVLLVLLGGVAGWIGGRRVGLAGILLLPAVLQAPALVPALTDYRDATVFVALAGVYLLSALATGAAWLAPSAWRLWLAPLAAVVYLIVLLLGPGLGALTQRPAPVSGFHSLLIAFGLVLVAAAPLFGVRGRPAVSGPRPHWPRRARARRRPAVEDRGDVAEVGPTSERWR